MRKLLVLILAAFASVTQGSWVADAAGSRLGFEASWDGDPFPTWFQRYEVRIDFEPAHPERAKFDVRVDIASLDSNSPDRDEGMREADWFDVARFSHARFRSERAEAAGDGGFRTRGMLHLRDRERPVAVPFRWSIEGEQRRLRGELWLDRRDFGIGAGEWATDPTIGYRVKVVFDLQLRAAP